MSRTVTFATTCMIDIVRYVTIFLGLSRVRWLTQQLKKITGWTNMWSGNEVCTSHSKYLSNSHSHRRTCKQFADHISGLTEGTYLWNEQGRRVPSAAVRKGLEYATEDIEAMNNYVLITPYTVDEDSGELVVTEEFTGRPPHFG